MLSQSYRADALATGRASGHVGVMEAPRSPIATPCVQVCIVDGESGLCLGCQRTLREVAAWARLSDSERQAIMTALPARRSQIRPEKLALVR